MGRRGMLSTYHHHRQSPVYFGFHGISTRQISITPIRRVTMLHLLEIGVAIIVMPRTHVAT